MNTSFAHGLALFSALLLTPLAAAAQPSPDGKSPPSRVVREDGVERPLWIDSDRVVDFDKQGAGSPSIRPVQPGEKSDGTRDSNSAADADSGISPVFVDSVGQPRALAGGVIVSLRQTLPEAQAVAQLEASGLVPLHRIGERMWLVDAPVGLPSLDLAEKLQGDERFDLVQPNWWRPRTKK